MLKYVFLSEVTSALTSSLVLNSALSKSVDVIKNYIPIDFLSVHLWDSETKNLRIIALTDGTNADSPNISIPIPSEYVSITEWEDDEQVKIYDDHTKNPISTLIGEAFPQLYGDKNLSRMIIRVKIEDKRICDVIALAHGKGIYTQQHAELFKILQSIFGVTISHGLHYNEILKSKKQLSEDNKILKEKLQNHTHTDIIGKESGLKDIMTKLEQVKHTHVPILLLGETGTGKDVLACELQTQGPRKYKAFIRINCGAIPETLLDSELFGHEKGSFTGAHSTHIGIIERAHGGTLFLDEVAELSHSAQVRLLRVLQNGEIERIGSTKTLHVDVRFIAATHSNLEELVKSGDFRADLYYRLSVFPIHIPPLRERIYDIPLLVEHIIRKCSINMNISPPKLAEGSLKILQEYHWPGNIRELTNIIEREIINKPAGPLSFSRIFRENTNYELDLFNLNQNKSINALPNLDEITKHYIEFILKNTQGKIHGKNGAAQILKINPHTLRSKMDKLNIVYKKNKKIVKL